MSTSHRSQEYGDTAWSDWAWNADRKQWGKWRMRKGKYEYRWQDPELATQSTSEGNEPEEGAKEEIGPQSPPEDDAIVTHTRVVAHLNQNVGGISENHWSIYLLLEGGIGSVRLNMSAPPGEITGTLSIDGFKYRLTNSALEHWDYKMVSGVTVKMVKDLVYSRGRDRYQFSGGGSGCRYWCYTILQDLETSKYVFEGTYANLWTHLQFRYSKSRKPVDLNWVVGEFI
ncbi:hypothetical protein DL98DRAFT_521701 [Cadophora sp. DSE1049]|nr:hypothetical protein DL98DRAFT_521701 [Cadophora sp. DSE1049]